MTTLSVSVGIDLADAGAGIFTELEWVPSDMRQAEERLQDIHLGKRKAPPIYEYIVVKDTIDGAMAGALLSKIRSIEDVVGYESDLANLGSRLSEADVAGARTRLASTSAEVVRAALTKARDRMLNPDQKVDERDELAALADEIMSVGIEPEGSNADSSDDEIPF